MPQSPARIAMVSRLRETAERDPRILGLVEYGSGSFGRADEWSDIDVALFIADEALDGFVRDWKAWAAGLGDLLLAYVGQFGHPWTIYDAAPVPLRMDFNFYPASQVDRIRNWPNSPPTIDAMLWYDGTGGRLAAAVEAIVGQSLAPRDLRGTFDRLCGDFWYFALYVDSKLRRGEGWVAREVLHCQVLDALFFLLRMEAGALDRWRESNAAFDIERTLTPPILARLEACVPHAGTDGVGRALTAAVSLGREVCAGIAAQHGWTWPETLGARVLSVLAASDGQARTVGG